MMFFQRATDYAASGQPDSSPRGAPANTSEGNEQLPPRSRPQPPIAPSQHPNTHTSTGTSMRAHTHPHTQFIPAPECPAAAALHSFFRRLPRPPSHLDQGGNIYDANRRRLGRIEADIYDTSRRKIPSGGPTHPFLRSMGVAWSAHRIRRPVDAGIKVRGITGGRRGGRLLPAPIDGRTRAPIGGRTTGGLTTGGRKMHGSKVAPTRDPTARDAWGRGGDATARDPTARGIPGAAEGGSVGAAGPRPIAGRAAQALDEEAEGRAELDAASPSRARGALMPS